MLRLRAGFYSTTCFIIVGLHNSVLQFGLLTKYTKEGKHGKIGKTAELVKMLQLKLHMVTIEELIPKDHFLRKLDAALNMNFVYEETEGLYSKKYGRPPIDPVVL